MGLFELSGMGRRDDSDAAALIPASGGQAPGSGIPGAGLSPTAGGQMMTGPVSVIPGPLASPAGGRAIPAMAQPQAPVVQAAPSMGQAPQRGFWDGFRAGAVSPAYANQVYQEKVNDYRNKVFGGVVKNLIGGRDPNTPMTWQDVQQAVGGVDPSLMGSKKFLTGMGYIMQDWNGRIAKQTQNQFNTARMYGAQINDPTTIQNFNRFGYMTPGQGAAQGQPRQNQGGLMDMAPEGGAVMSPGWGMPQGAPRTFTLPKQSAKAQAFPGAVNKQAQPTQDSLTIPRDADIKFGDEMRTYGGKALVDLSKARAGLPLAQEKARLKAEAGQEELTKGHQARRMFDQANPPGGYVTSYDPLSKRQKRVWTGGQAEVDLGPKPEPAKNQNYNSARSAVDRYFMPPGVMGEIKRLRPEEQKKYLGAMKRFERLQGQGANPTQAYLGAIDSSYVPAGGATPQSKSKFSGPQIWLHYPDARQGTDGNWYVRRNGKLYQVGR